MRGLLIGTVLALVAMAAPARAQDHRPCFDVAVVARLTKIAPDPIPDLGPDTIVMRWPWSLEFQTEQVLIGHVDRSRLQVTMSLHTYFRGGIDHFLLFLKRQDDGSYVAVNFETRVIEDRFGRFIVPIYYPLYEPDDLDEFVPGDWPPINYEQFLTPIRYDPEDAWWMDHINEDEYADVPAGWFTRRGRNLVALRGLRLRDLPRMIAQDPAAICPAA